MLRPFFGFLKVLFIESMQTLTGQISFETDQLGLLVLKNKVVKIWL